MSKFLKIKDSVINLDLVTLVTLEAMEGTSFGCAMMNISFSGGGFSKIQFDNVTEAREVLQCFVGFEEPSYVEVGTNIGGLVLTQLDDDEDGNTQYRWVREQTDLDDAEN